MKINKSYALVASVFTVCSSLFGGQTFGDGQTADNSSNKTDLRDAPAAVPMAVASIATDAGMAPVKYVVQPAPAVPKPVPTTRPSSNCPIMKSGELWQFALRACQEGIAVPKTVGDIFPYVWPGSTEQHDTRQLVEGNRLILMPLEQCPEKGKLVLTNDPLISLVVEHRYKSFTDVFATTQKGEMKVYLKWPVNGQPTPMEPTSLERDRFQKEKDFWVSKYPPLVQAQSQPAAQSSEATIVKN